MKYESLARMHQLRYADQAAGVKRTPLYSLQECCEAAGVAVTVFGRWAAKYPGAPKPVLVNPATTYRPKKQHYRKSEVVQWVNQIRQQIQAEKKGNIMPDLQSELSKVLTEWSEPEVKPEPTAKPTPSDRPVFAETTGTSRATSDYIRLNPGTARVDVLKALTSQGHARATIYSLLVQMKRQGLINDDDGRLTANYTEYTPVKTHATWKKIEIKAGSRAARAAQRAEGKPPKRKYTRRNAEAKAAAYEAHENYNPTAVVAEPKVVAPPEFDAEAFVNGLTLKQAKAVYGELKKVFE